MPSLNQIETQILSRPYLSHARLPDVTTVDKGAISRVPGVLKNKRIIDPKPHKQLLQIKKNDKLRLPKIELPIKVITVKEITLILREHRRLQFRTLTNFSDTETNLAGFLQ